MRPCELYLVRHALAAVRGEEWPDDTKRPLTATGVSRFTEAVDGLAWLGVTVDEIFSSPLVRARQTADILSARLPDRTPIKLVDELAPGHDPALVRAELAKRSKRRRIAVVGHEPDLGEFAAHLLGTARAIPFKKGAVCRIDLNGLSSTSAGSLIWFLPPRLLRKAGQ